MTVADLHDEMARLLRGGHGRKAIGFPEGFHSSGASPLERIEFKVDENDTPEDSHPGFVWISIVRESATPDPARLTPSDEGKAIGSAPQGLPPPLIPRKADPA
jgi:hypothetical protein